MPAPWEWPFPGALGGAWKLNVATDGQCEQAAFSSEPFAAEVARPQPGCYFAGHDGSVVGDDNNGKGSVHERGMHDGGLILAGIFARNSASTAL